MGTTTLRLPSELKSRVAEVAERVGLSAHSFMLQAVEEKTAKIEQETAFSELADERYQQLLADGEVLAWDEVKSYLKERVQNNVAEQPASYKKE